MSHFSSAPRALIAILALASLTAGCSQMRAMTSGDSGATSMSGSSGGASGSGGGDSGRLINNSGQTQGTTPGASVPVSDGSR
jgi:hypothetical protein